MFAHSGFGLVAIMLLGLSAATCGTLALSGWRRHHHPLAHQDSSRPLPATRPVFDVGRTPLVGGMLDLAAEARGVLAQMAAEAARQLVQLEFAVQPDLAMHADRRALRAVLAEIVANAVRHTAGGRVLLSAIRLGGRVQIAVIDDGAGPAATVQQAALRASAELVALQGGTIDVEVHPGEGTTVVVRLPEAAEIGLGVGQPASPPPARPAAVPARAARETGADQSWDT